MSLLNKVLVLSAALASASAQGAERTAPAEKKMSPSEVAVRSVVQQHIDGIVHADAEMLEKAWDTKMGQISFVQRNEDGEEVVHTGPITESFKLWTARKHHGTKGTIQNVDIVNDKMALVKAQVHWKGQVFDDYLTLFKTEGQWKLVSKTYSSKRASFGYGVSLRY